MAEAHRGGGAAGQHASRAASCRAAQPDPATGDGFGAAMDRRGEDGRMTDHIERVRRACLALPEATEQEAWGEPTFRVRKKVFAMHAAAGNHHGAGHESLWC